MTEKQLFNEMLNNVTKAKLKNYKFYLEATNKIKALIEKYVKQQLKVNTLRNGQDKVALTKKQLKQLEKDIEKIIIELNNKVTDNIEFYFGLNYTDGYYGSLYNFETLLQTQTANIIPFLLLPTQRISNEFKKRIAGLSTPERLKKTAQHFNKQIIDLVIETVEKGESVAYLEKRLLEIGYNGKINTTARTELLRSYSESQKMAREEVEEAGIELETTWISTLDSKVRATHARVDNRKAKIVDGLTAFKVGGVLMQAPRIVHPKNTSSKTAKEVINCRCRSTDSIKGIDNNNRLIKINGKWKETTAKSSDYKDWKKFRTQPKNKTK